MRSHFGLKAIAAVLLSAFAFSALAAPPHHRHHKRHHHHPVHHYHR